MKRSTHSGNPLARMVAPASLAALLLVACGSPSAAPPSAQASGAAAAKASLPSSSQATAAASRAAVAGSPTGSATPGAGISLAPPVLIHIGDRNLPAVLVTNISGQPRSLSLSATWKQGDAVVATATGGAFGLLPNETRAVNLASQQPVPDGAGNGQAQVVRDLPVDPKDIDVESKIHFGTPTIEKTGLSSIAVDVTNTDTTGAHSFMVGGALLSNGMLLATAFGSITDLGPALTEPVQMEIAGPDTGYDRVLVYVVSVSK